MIYLFGISFQEVLMTVQECIRTRRSIRKFKPTPIDHAVIEEIISDTAMTPSWKNSQTVRYICVEGALKDRISKEATTIWPGNGTIIEQAPALIVVVSIDKRSGYERDGSASTPKGDGWTMFDAGAASQTLCLSAHDHGLGTVIMGLYDESTLTDILELEDGRSVSALIPIGYPDIDPDAPKRKEVSDLLSFKS